MTDAAARLPGGARRAAGRRGRARSASVTAAARTSSPGARPASTCWCWTRPTCSRDRATRTWAPTAATGPTTRCASPRSRAAAADLGRGACSRALARRRARARLAGRPHARLLRYGTGAHARTVMTVHNLAFQGQFPPRSARRLGLPPRRSRSTASNTTAASASSRPALRSPTASPRSRRPMPARSARRRAAWASTACCASARRCSAASSTASTPGLEPGHRSAARRALRRRGPCRARREQGALQARFGLAADPGAPLFGVVSRLTWQKGMDLLHEALPGVSTARARSSPSSAPATRRSRRRSPPRPPHPGRMATMIGYDESLAHLVQAGADALLVPSRFEPCGLTQLFALRYGALPVVARVGGLADTVVDANEMALAASAGTGILFSPVSRERWRSPSIARRRCGDGDGWRRVQARAMFTDVSWRGRRGATRRSTASSSAHARCRCAVSASGNARPPGRHARGGRRQRRRGLRARRRRGALPVRRDRRDRDGTHRLPERTGDVFHGFVAGHRPRHSLRAARARPLGPRARPRVQSGQAAGRPLCSCARPRVRARPDPVRPPSRRLALQRRQRADVPRAVATEPLPPASDVRPRVPWNATVVYELHVRGFTAHAPRRAGGAAGHLRGARASGGHRASRRGSASPPSS